MVLTTRLRSEGGFAVLTAIVLMTIMLGASLAVVAYVDTETHQSKVGRNRETSFNVAEAALNTQVYDLSLNWPGKGGLVRFPVCTPTTGTAQCPSNSRLLALFPSADTAVGTSWRTEIRDNVLSAPTFYSDAFTANQPGYDANGDDMVWVRAQGLVRGKTRILVALVRAEWQFEDLPRAGVITGSLTFGNNGPHGNKQFVDTGTSTLGVETRCDPLADKTKDCEGLPANDKQFQDSVQTAIQPYKYSPNYPDLQTLSADALERLKATARAEGTYYTACPSDLSGDVVVLDMHGTCSKTGSTTYNSQATPGMLILLNRDSVLTLGGTVKFYGVIYHANLPMPGAATTVVEVTGNAMVDGGIVVDGQGQLGMDGSSFLSFDESGFGSVRSIGSAGIVQNTWRELRST